MKTTTPAQRARIRAIVTTVYPETAQQVRRRYLQDLVGQRDHLAIEIELLTAEVKLAEARGEK